MIPPVVWVAAGAGLLAGLLSRKKDAPEPEPEKEKVPEPKTEKDKTPEPEPEPKPERDSKGRFLPKKGEK